MTGYLMVDPPDIRYVPGLTEKPLSNGDRIRLGIDCDEVFPKIVLGNGVTLRKKSYLHDIGITHILNAAESRGVNVGKEYFGDEFQYMGLKIEDTPQTQICR
jgi:atypical dual specificity phosphatase/dual specificity phosphatase 3